MEHNGRSIWNYAMQFHMELLQKFAPVIVVRCCFEWQVCSNDILLVFAVFWMMRGAACVSRSLTGR